MKIKATQLFSLVTALVTIASAQDSTGGNKIITAEQISKSVVKKPLTRSFNGTAARRGYQPASGTRSYNQDSKPTGRTRDFTEVEVLTDTNAKIELPNIAFKVGTVIPLDATVTAQLKELANALKGADPKDKFLIEGHTCPKGGNDINNPLSVARAQWVKDYLIGEGVTVELKFLGCGSSEAAAQSLTSASPESELAPYRKVMLHKARE